MKERRDEVDTLLALGATRWRRTAIAISRSASLLPTTASLASSGIVTIGHDGGSHRGR